ncbi:ArsR/SmtB family transcription factor [Longispora albida]|uniref:ArsR/SmtB family transcription factor n=1 Tax=Longispora albida TaxID=203523 RepID=UPI00035F7EB7|nr:winged helix-turn-helix domain-containing protein [Longispora albida]
MLRIHLTPADLGRVTLATGPDVMQEVQHSVLMLDPAWGGGWAGRWRRSVLPRLSPDFRPVLDLMPVIGYTPDFLCAPGARDVHAAVDEIVSAPGEQVRAELGEFAASTRRPLSSWALDLAAGDAGARRKLRAALTRYYEIGLAPEWDTVTAGVTADRAVRGQLLLDGGLDRLLGTLHPDITWDSPMLSIRCPQGTQQPWDFHLGGRGLLLVPLYFGGVSTYLEPPAGPAILGYPIPHGPVSIAPDGRLVSLLGRTRATVLSALRTAGSTTQVAQRVGTSLASVSQHTTVLRDAGLISTTRLGGAVLHALTPLGAGLLGED